MHSDNEIPLFLIDEFKNSNVVLFIGAGISMNSGLPSWTELLDFLGKSVLSSGGERYQFFKSCNSQEKAQYLYDVTDKVTIINKVSQFFLSSLDEDSDYDIHKKISALPVDTLITTNWDNIIEDTFRKEGIDLVKIWKDEQMSSVIYGGKNLIKLHGTIEEPSSIIFSEEDYNSSFNINPLLKTYLSTILSRSTILMLGYSYQDINFKVVQNFVNRQLGSSSKKVYALFLNENHQRLHYLESRGIICLNFVDSSRKLAITDFFNKLYGSVSISANTPLERLKIVSRENGEVLQRYSSIILRNMSALGPLATPESAEHEVFGKNTQLEIICAKNWRSILDKKNSSAKIVLCLNDTNSKEVFNKNGYIQRIETLIENLKKYQEKIQVVDTGNPLIMSNFDIYGNIVFLENIKTDVNNMGYGYLKVHRDKNIIKMNTNIFEKIFESIRALNIVEANSEGITGNDENDIIFNLIIYRLNNFLKKVNQW